MPVTIPCRQCIGCRIEQSRQWAVRCVYEAQMHEENCFITLTYNDKHLPKDHSLHLEDIQKFFKRLRKANPGKQIRYLQCGEYGEQFSRPHYHACIFNHDFDDKEHYDTKEGNPLYTSETLNKIWKKGYCIIGEVTFDSAAYVARYITKKVNKSEDEYQRIVYLDNNGQIEIHPVAQEFGSMSKNKGGLAKEWFDKYKNDVYPHDYVTVNGIKMQPPKYFDKLLEETDLIEYLKIKAARNTPSDEETQERLLAKEKFKNLQLKQKLQRNYENGQP